MKVRKSDVGRLCMVRWDDIGRIECMVVDHDHNGYVQVYNFSDRKIETVDESSQIVELGKFVTPNDLTPA